MTLPKGYFVAGLLPVLLIELSDLPSVQVKIVWKLLSKNKNRGFDKVPRK